jgi:carnitine O-acetyltransferase
VWLVNGDELIANEIADGFFDAGMLLQALKARGENYDTGETRASERAQVQARRRDVGKKLRLIDY